jgi:hypothetical protein
VLLALKAGNLAGARRASSKARSTVLEPLAAASMESYQRAYKLLTRLQQLQELEQVETVLFDAEGKRRATEDAKSRASELAAEWDQSLDLTQAGLLFIEPLLSHRRVVTSPSRTPTNPRSMLRAHCALLNAASHMPSERD